MKKNLLLFLPIVFVLFLTFTIHSHNAYAQGGGTLPSCNGLPDGEILSWPHCTLLVLGQLITTMVTGALGFGAILLLFNFFKAAFDYLTAGDSTEKLEKARSNITWSIVGLVGVGSVFIIFKLILDLIPGLKNFIT